MQIVNNLLLRESAHDAKRAHQDQEYGIFPYVKHLEDVYQVLIRFGFGDDQWLLIGSWLHDIIEDTDWKYNDVKSKYGYDIAEMVYGVTDEMGRNRIERKKKTYEKIKANYKSLILKLADRIANMEFSALSLFGDPSKFDMYRKEDIEFQKALRVSYGDNPSDIDLKIENMWKHIDKLIEEN